MSGIVLSASVRQNLLSLQSTADLLATTQNRLASGKKVNSALDNPTNYFTAAGLDSRASDINNLLDGIGNGVQILQAANTGITSLNKLVDTAKSIANQALQTTVGYSTKSNVSTNISGATPEDLRGTTTYASAQCASSNVLSSAAPPAAPPRSPATTTLAAPPRFRWSGVAVAEQRRHRRPRSPRADPDQRRPERHLPSAGNRAPVDGDTFTVNGKTITFRAGTPPAAAVLPAGSASPGNHRHRRQRQFDRLYRHQRQRRPPRSTTWPTPSTSPAASSQAVHQRQRREHRRAPTRRADPILHRRRRPYPQDRHRQRSQHHRQGRSSQGARPHPADRRRHRQRHRRSRQITATALGTLMQDGSTLNVNGKTITFRNAAAPAAITFRPARASSTASSPTAAAIRRSICRTAQSATC